MTQSRSLYHGRKHDARLTPNHSKVPRLYPTKTESCRKAASRTSKPASWLRTTTKRGIYIYIIYYRHVKNHSTVIYCNVQQLNIVKQWYRQILPIMFILLDLQPSPVRCEGHCAATNNGASPWAAAELKSLLQLERPEPQIQSEVWRLI